VPRFLEGTEGAGASPSLFMDVLHTLMANLRAPDIRGEILCTCLWVIFTASSSRVLPSEISGKSSTRCTKTLNLEIKLYSIFQSIPLAPGILPAIAPVYHADALKLEI